MPLPPDGLVGWLLVTLVTFAGAAGGGLWLLLGWFQKSMLDQQDKCATERAADKLESRQERKEQAAQFLQAFRDQRAEFTAAIKDLSAAQAARDEARDEQIRQWRMESLAEAKASREATQTLMNRLAEVQWREDHESPRRRIAGHEDTPRG